MCWDYSVSHNYYWLKVWKMEFLPTNLSASLWRYCIEFISFIEFCYPKLMICSVSVTITQHNILEKKITPKTLKHVEFCGIRLAAMGQCIAWSEVTPHSRCISLTKNWVCTQHCYLGVLTCSFTYFSRLWPCLNRANFSVTRRSTHCTFHWWRTVHGTILEITFLVSIICW